MDITNITIMVSRSSRESQLNSWLNQGPPNVYWLTGFFNPQGFLTAMKQEVTRRHKAERWALDDVVLRTYILDEFDHRKYGFSPLHWLVSLVFCY